MEINKLGSTNDRSSSLRDADGKPAAGAASDLRQQGPARGSSVEGADTLSAPTKVALSAIAQGLAEAADVQASDVDLDRVQQIRSAIEQGTYHVDPQRLAANFVDLEHQLFG